jgi:hypothetical protein
MNFYPKTITRNLLSPVNLVGSALLVVLSYLILLPLVQLIIRTFVWGPGDQRISREAVEGNFTLFHWNEALTGGLSAEMLYEPLLNTMVTGYQVLFWRLYSAHCLRGPLSEPTFLERASFARF